MHIQVLDNQEIVFDAQVEKSSIIIGRGSDCDIRCINEVISRKHLEITKNEDQLKIKNLSKNNWIILNDEKINHNDYIDFFDFYQLQLPGNIEISISQESEDVLEELRSVSSNIDISENESTSSETINKKNMFSRKQKNTAHDERDKNKANELLKMSGILFVVIVAILFQFRDVLMPSEEEVNLKSSTTEKVVTRRKKLEMNMEKVSREAIENYQDIKNVEDPKTYIKCVTAQESNLCDEILRRRVELEGISVSGENLFAFIEIGNRIKVDFNNTKLYKSVPALTNAELSKVLAAHYFLSPKRMYQLKEKGIENIFVHVIKDSYKNQRVLDIFSISFENKIRFNQIDYRLAVDDVLMKNDFKSFNKYIKKFLIKVD